MLSPIDGVVNYFYDSKKQILQIRFHSGNVFEYLGVKSNAYEVFNAAKDKNEVFKRSIEGKYPTRQVFQYIKTIRVDGVSKSVLDLEFENSDSIDFAFDGNKVTASVVGLPASTPVTVPLILESGTKLSVPVAGALEYDGTQLYFTIDTGSGSGAIPVEQYFHLVSAGAPISTIANFFGSPAGGSNISLVASAYYIIDVYAWFLNTTIGTVTWSFINSAAPTSQNVFYESSPATGIVAPPGSAGMLQGQIYNDATANLTITMGSISNGTNHFMHTRIYLRNGTGTSLQIQATKSAGSITPGINSYWFCRRMSPNSVGILSP